MSSAFEAIIGHAAQTQYIERVIEQESLAHAYCFSGPEHLGKMTVALALAARLLGVASLETHPDVRVIERLEDEKKGVQKDKMSIEQIRELAAHLTRSSFIGGKKVAIVNDADTMTVQAQNGLLKTLEEPKGDALIILIAHDATRLLPTILSRTVHIRFAPVAQDVCVEALETHGIETSEARVRARAAMGCPGRALGAEDPALMHEAVAFLSCSLPERLARVQKVAKTDAARQEAAQFLFASRALLHDVLAVATQAEQRVRLSTATDADLASCAAKVTPRACVHGLLATQTALEHLQNNANVSLSLEHYALSL